MQKIARFRQLCLQSPLIYGLMVSTGLAQIGDPYQINTELPPTGDVSTYSISPNGARVVYLAGQDAGDFYDLYSVPITGGAAIKLNANLVFGGEVFSFLISADSQYVVYRADQDTNEVFELYSVPITGGVPTKLNTTPVNGGDVSFGKYIISADSQYVTYLADQSIDNTWELFSVPITGGVPVKLNTTFNIGDPEFSYEAISPDSQYVISRYADEIYSVPIAGGTPVNLNTNLTASGNLPYTRRFQISPDSQHIIYLADLNGGGTYEMFSVPISGGTITKISGNLVSGGSVDIFGNFRISPDGQYVIYIADQDTDNITELYSVPISGGMVKKLNENLVSGGYVDIFGSSKVSPDSQTVVYVAVQDTENVSELYSVPITGGASTKLNLNLTNNGDVFAFNEGFQISANGQYVIYKADPDGDQIFTLYSVPMTGGPSIQLNSNPVPGGNIIPGPFQISQDSQDVFYQFDQDVDQIDELYTVSIAGGIPVKLNASLPLGSEVHSFSLSRNNDFLVYRADQDILDKDELFGINLNKSDTETDELCIPIKLQNNAVTVICL